MTEETELAELDEANNLPFQTDDERMAYTQNIRKRLVVKMTASGIPEDKGEKAVLLTALADIDRAALGNKRIAAASKDSHEDRQAAMIIAALSAVRYPTPSGSPFEAPIIEGQFRELPPLNESNLPALVLVPGETDIGNTTRTYDEFMADTE